MSGIKLTYTIDDAPVREFMSRLTGADTRLMFEEIGGYLDSETEQRFLDGIGPDGSPTEPSQRSIKDGGVPLIDHNILKDSYTHNVFNDGMGVEHGSNMIYSAIQHFGGKTGRNHSVELPARPKAGINDYDEVEIKTIVNDFYKRVVQS